MHACLLNMHTYEYIYCPPYDRPLPSFVRNRDTGRKEMKDLMTFAGVLLGFGSLKCGLLAANRRPKRDDIILDGVGCVYPMSPSFPLGLAAAAMLLLAVSLVTRCCTCCCRRRDGVTKMSFGFGIFFAVLSWLLVLDTEFSFLIAITLNWPGRRSTAQACYVAVQADNLFTSPAFNGMFAILFGVASQRMLRPVVSLQISSQDQT